MNQLYGATEPIWNVDEPLVQSLPYRAHSAHQHL